MVMWRQIIGTHELRFWRGRYARDDDFATSEQAGIKRVCARAEESSGQSHHDRIYAQGVTAEEIPTRRGKPGERNPNTRQERQCACNRSKKPDEQRTTTSKHKQTYGPRSKAQALRLMQVGRTQGDKCRTKCPAQQ